MDSAIARSTPARLPAQSLLILGLLILAIAAVVVLVGSGRHVPPPYGLADNGQLAYGSKGDIYVRDALTAEPRLLIGGDGEQGGVAYSLDGQRIAYDNVVKGVDHVTVAQADGSNPRAILDIPFSNGSASWSPDSQSMALVTDRIVETAPGVFAAERALFIAAADGSGAREVPLDGLSPLDVLYNPANDGTLLIRAKDGSAVNLFLVASDGRVVRSYDLPGDMLYGADWELSGLAFSPDGRTIAHNVVADETGAVTFRAWLLEADGTNHRPLPPPIDAPPTYSQAWPIYAPDGAWIALESWVGAPGGTAVNQIAIAPADGSLPAHGVGPAIPNQSLVKAWSPDGRTLLVGVRDENEVWAIDPATGTANKLAWSSDLPDWQRAAR